jgi:hypothetical protein
MWHGIYFKTTAVTLKTLLYVDVNFLNGWITKDPFEKAPEVTS